MRGAAPSVRSGGAPAADVVRAGAAQLDALVPLFDAYRRFYGQAGDLPAARRFLGERLARDESVVFLATLGGEPAGFTQLYPLFSSISVSRLWLLNDLFVTPPARRHGVAGALLAAARRHGEATGAAALLLQTTVDNKPAQALYERNGWVREAGFYWYGLALAPRR